MSNIVLCKLTDQDLRTHGGFQWELNVSPPKLSGVGGLCSGGYYHCYEHPLLAVLLNPVHAKIKNPRGFYVDVEGEAKTDFGLIRGYPFMVLREEFTLPEITFNQRIAFGILCALEVREDVYFRNWAEKWLSGEDRTVNSLEEAWRATWAALWVSRAAQAAAYSDTSLDLIALAEKALTYN